MSTHWKNWLLDVSFWRDDMPPCFVPYEGNGDIITGMNLLTDQCPGNLVGVYHEAGKQAAEAWCAEHPDWRTKYVRSADIARSNAMLAARRSP